jgi:hypothetical protein
MRNDDEAWLEDRFAQPSPRSGASTVHVRSQALNLGARAKGMAIGFRSVGARACRGVDPGRRFLAQPPAHNALMPLASRRRRRRAEPEALAGWCWRDWRDSGVGGVGRLPGGREFGWRRCWFDAFGIPVAQGLEMRPRSQ